MAVTEPAEVHSARSVMHLAVVHAASEPTAMSYFVGSAEEDAAHAHVQCVDVLVRVLRARARDRQREKSHAHGGSEATAAGGADAAHRGFSL